VVEGESTVPYIQTSAAISPGSSGGGLFDTQGRLLGITTLILSDRYRLAQNLNIAVPAEWIHEVPERSKAALAARKTTTDAAGGAVASRMPGAGSTWTYKAIGPVGSSRTFKVTAKSSGHGFVVDTIENTDGGSNTREVIGARGFLYSRAAGGRTIVEFSPYILATFGGSDREPRRIATEYRATRPGYTSTGSEASWETVSVPAGTFKVLRTELRIDYERQNPRPSTVRWRQTFWYAPEVGRYVRAVFDRAEGPSDWQRDHSVDMLDYKLN
jgi:hypothetical protein